MSEKDNEWTNELMDEEDDLLKKMRKDYCQRLEKRLQRKVQKMEQKMPEVDRLKKKTGGDQPDNCHRRGLSSSDKGILPDS